MREIRFRAWDEENKRFLYFSLAGLSYSSDTGSINVEDWDDIVSVDDLRWQQYIGLKDKNGKEVYEGDIVRFKHNADNIIGGQTRIGKVMFFRECLRFGFKTGKKDYDWWSYNEDMFDFEILGNTFENPNLLEDS